jgi:thioredoxin-related protein
MKTKILFFFIPLIISAISICFINKAEINELPINSSLPKSDYLMKDVSGKQVTLNELKTNKGLLVIFSCNTCPYVLKSEGRIKSITDFCLSNGIGCAIINSNEAQRNEEDSFEEMIKYYTNQKLKCVYLIDEKSQLADAFGAAKTPHCFLFNSKTLIYKGAIDDNIKDPSAVKAFYLKDALTSLLKNERPQMQETKSIGCSIKRLE